MTREEAERLRMEIWVASSKILEKYGVSFGPRKSKPKGRPLEKDRSKSLEATRPWEAEGMSRATWFRRKGKS